MTNKLDGTWDPVGSKLRDSLRNEYKLCGEGCVYVDMVRLKDHSPVDWPDHSAVHAIVTLAHGGHENIPSWPFQPTDTAALREAVRDEFIAQTERFEQSFEDERDEWADRHAIVALKGINSFLAKRSG